MCYRDNYFKEVIVRIKSLFMRIKLLFFVAMLFVTFSVSAQEQLGLKLGNYAGVNSFGLNPAWHVNGPLKWDVTILALGVFAEQNYIYGQKGSVTKLIKNGGSVITEDQNTTDGTTTGSEVPFYFQDNANYDIHFNAFAMAPSFMFNVRKHTFGLYMQGRGFGSGYNLDGEFNYNNLSDTLVFVGEMKPFQMGAMAWGEIGATYGKNIVSNRNFDINVGGTLKFLIGFAAANVKNNTTTNVTRGEDQVILDAVDLDMAYTSAYSSGSVGFQRSGFGMATDVGVTIVNKKAKQDKQHYKWKLGVSLLDVGRIKYNKSAASYNYTSTEVSIFSDEDFENIEDPDDFINAINNSGNASSAELVKSDFGMWMPMALSVQFDAPLIDRLYVSGTAVVGMRFRGAAIERSDLIAVTPRFEAKWFEIGMPVSLYRWTDFQMGTYLRMGPLTIGTDNLNSLVIPGKFEGADFYLALKVNSAMFKKCDRKRNGEKGSGCFATQF